MAKGSVLGKRRQGGRSTAGQGRKKYAKTQLSIARRVNLGRDIHYFRRMAASPGSFPGVNDVAHNPFLQANSFTFSQLAGSAELVALFDQFRIDYIEVKFYLKVDPSAQAAASATFPRIYWVIDNDDSDTGFTLNNLREHNRCKVRVLNPNRAVTIRFKPSVLTMKYKTAVSTSYGPSWSQWIDCNDSSTPHWGIKWAVDDLRNTNYILDTETTMWVSCRGAR